MDEGSIDLAANSLRPSALEVLRKGMKQAAFVALDGNNLSRQVVSDWISRTDLKTLPFRVDDTCLEESNRRFSPIVFPHRWNRTKLRNERMGKYIILIALEDLSDRNGLMLVSGGPEKLKKGDWMVFRGDDELTLETRGGGIAIWFELDILSNGVHH